MKVLVTGATSGIGKALVEHYAAGEHQVIACGRSSAKLEQFNHYQRVDNLIFDVTDKQAVLASADGVDELDILILNAGDCEYFDEVVPFDSDKFERIININLVSMGYCLEGFLHKLSAGGQLVIVSSSAVMVPFPKAQAYGASKAGCSYLAKSLAVDLVAKGIDVTLVEPGFVKTPLTDKNNFDMPFLVTSEVAAHTIIKGIEKRKALVRFPSALMVSLRLLALLPIRTLAKILNRK